MAKTVLRGKPKNKNIIINYEKLKGFISRSGTRKSCPLLSSVLNIVLEFMDK